MGLLFCIDFAELFPLETERPSDKVIRLAATEPAIKREPSYAKLLKEGVLTWRDQMYPQALKEGAFRRLNGLKVARPYFGGVR